MNHLLDFKNINEIEKNFILTDKAYDLAKVQELRARGAKLNERCYEGKKKRTAFQLAVMYSSLEVVNFLKEQEGVDLIDSMLAEDKSLSRAPISAQELGLMPDLVTEAGDLRTLPVHYSNLGGMDGFYAARLIRN